MNNPGIGTDLTRANSWLLRSPGILSHRVLRRFLLPRWRLSDQPSEAMRNPSHQLNSDHRSKGHARSRARFDAGLAPTPLGRERPRSFGQVPRDCRGNHPCGFVGTISKLRSILRNARRASPARPPGLPETAVFEADCTECNRLIV